MKKCADLEVTLNRGDGGNFSALLRCTLPGDDVDVTRSGTAQFDFQQLRGLSLESAEYATLLTDCLFRDPAVASAFAEARSAAQALEASLRIKLSIGANAPELHGLRWEALLDPRDGTYLFADEQVLLSRYLGSLDWQPVRLRPQAQLTALVVIANPTNLTEFNLTPVDVNGELARAQTSMSRITVSALASAGTATLANLTDRLRDGGTDILYLVCHGSIVDGEPWLWMEDESGAVARVRGADLVARLKQLQERPRLVVLASCQSAGSGTDSNTGGALVSLGPRLAAAGIPAVLAMQGSVSMETVARFMPVFFSELLRDGLIDRATAVARGSVSDRPDFWMPVLFMRLKSGRIWEDAGDYEIPPLAAAAAAGGSERQSTVKPVIPPPQVKHVPAQHRELQAPSEQPAKKSPILRWALALLLVVGAATTGWWVKYGAKPAAPAPVLPKPAIQSFSVLPLHVKKGQKVTISWQVDNADDVELSPFGRVNPSGSMSFEPTESTIFNLVAKNEAGTDSKQSQVVVLPENPPSRNEAGKDSKQSRTDVIADAQPGGVGGSASTVQQQTQRIPAISNIVSSSGSVSGRVTISGSGFDGTTRVTFNSRMAQINSTSDSQLVVTAPPLPLPSPQTEVIVLVCTTAGCGAFTRFRFQPCTQFPCQSNPPSNAAIPNFGGAWAEMPPYLDPTHPGKMVITQTGAQVRFSGNYCGNGQLHAARLQHTVTSNGIEWKTFHTRNPPSEVETEAEADFVDTFRWSWDGSTLSCLATYNIPAANKPPGGAVKSQVRKYQRVANTAAAIGTTVP